MFREPSSSLLVRGLAVLAVVGLLLPVGVSAITYEPADLETEGSTP